MIPTDQTGQDASPETVAALPEVLDGFDLSDLDRFADGFPHHIFTRLRLEAPVLRHPMGLTKDREPFWVLSRHADIARVADDPTFSSKGGGGRAHGGTHIDDLPQGIYAGVLLNMTDDPRHAWLRQAVEPAVTGAAIVALEPTLREIATDLVADAVARGSVDFQTELAGPFAVYSMGELLAMPTQDWKQLFQWTQIALGYEDRSAGEATDRSLTALIDSFNYGRELLDTRKAASAGDFLSLVARAELPAGQGEPPLTDYERQVFFNLISLAGSEPTRGAIAIGMLALAEHPDQWQALRADRSLLPGAVEEILRWSSPTPYNRRTATRDTMIGDTLIKAGEKVTLWWASANRDEEVFTDPFRFDIRRGTNPHLAFGHGTHRCLGSDELARLELRLIFDALLDQVEEVTATGDVTWARHNKHTVVLRMPVTLTPSGAPVERSAERRTPDAIPQAAPAEEPISTTPAAPAALALFLPFNPADRISLYEVFRTVREKSPVVRGPAGVQAVLTHREVAGVLRDPRFGWGAADTVSNHFMKGEDGEVVRQFIFMDPPDHTRIRSLVTKAFSARMIERLRPRTEALVRELVGELKEKGASGDPVDLMATVAHPLPALVLGELMGVPPENRERFKEWSRAIARGLDPDFMLTAVEIAERDGARANFNAYFGELAAERRDSPGDDLVSQLVQVEAEGDRLRAIDLVTTCTLLLSAGYATTSNLIGNSMLALLQNPDQLAFFRANPDQVPAMVEELHRYDSPVQMISRTALADATVGDATFNAGEPVLLVIGAANHDPAVYEEPDRLDLTRRSDKHLGFGLGIHYCVGAPMARLTAQLTLQLLAELDLGLTAEAPPVYAENLIMRGLASLPVTVG